MIVGRITFGPKPIIQFVESKGEVPKGAIDPILESFGLRSINATDSAAQIPLLDFEELHKRNTELVHKRFISRR